MHEKESILLVSLRSGYLDSDRVYPPLALLYLKSYIEQFGFQVGLEDDFDFDNMNKYEKYDCIGVSVMTPQREDSNRFLSAWKSLFPDKPIIIGGPHAKHYFSDVNNMAWDHIVTDDGQRSLLKIMKGDGSRIEKDVMSKQEWASMPCPDRTSDISRIMLSHYNYNLMGRKSATMLTSTGCVMKCRFCEAAGSFARWSSHENICRELDDIKSLGYGGVYLFDDLFAISIKKARPICEELKKRDLIYRCNGQANYFSEDFAKMLADTGCVEIAFGAESGSQKMLDAVDKRTTVKQNYDFVRLCKKYDIICKAFLMIGLPGETYDTIKETEKFIETSGIDDAQIAIYYPYKGTLIRKDMDNGRDIGVFFEHEGLGAYGRKGGNSEAVIHTNELSAEDLLRERDRLVSKFKPKSHNKKWEGIKHA